MKKHKASITLLAIISIVSVPYVVSGGRKSQVAGHTYYVATNGSDSNPCSSSAPCRTLQHAFAIAGPGDTILIRSGTYAGFKSINHGGSPGTPITIKPDQGAIVTIDSSITPEPWPGHRYAVYLADGGASYITFDGNNGVENEALRFTTSDWGTQPGSLDKLWTPKGGTNQQECQARTAAGARRGAMYLTWNTSDTIENHPRGITIRNTRMVDIPSSFIEGATRNFLFENNHMYNTRDRNVWQQTPYGFYIAAGDNLVWRGNRIHGLYVGIRTGTPGKAVTNARIENNLIYDNWGKGIFAGPGFCHASAGGNGILLPYTADSIVRNNIVWGNRLPGNEGWGEKDYSAWSVVGIAARGNKVYNNTVFGHGPAYPGYASPEGISANSGGDVRNNISFDNGIDLALNGASESNNLTTTPISSGTGD
ncbi:MAG: right-handed parallel beta-helix repeat-containing protein [Candidatus Tectomicrobia bacterium]|nr:right-handed parallel beta-helix repeat-containing protein [Candidatus Tectomicrobia bacterium]